MSGVEIEQRQARAVLALQEAAARRAAAAEALEEATEAVRLAVIEARAAGVTVRRTAEVGQVAPDTVQRWTTRKTSTHGGQA